MIAAREVPSFYEMEETFVNTSKADTAAVLEIIADPSKGRFLDKLRLTVAAISARGEITTAAEVVEYRAALAAAAQGDATITDEDAVRYCNVLQHVARVKSQQPDLVGGASGVGAAGSGSAAGGGAGGGVGAGFTSLMGGMGKMLEGAKAWIPSADKKSKVTEIVQSLCTGSNGGGGGGGVCDAYLYIDPKLKLKLQGADAGRRGAAGGGGASTFGDAIVFVVGGGNYTEYVDGKRGEVPALQCSALCVCVCVCVCVVLCCVRMYTCVCGCHAY